MALAPIAIDTEKYKKRFGNNWERYLDRIAINDLLVQAIIGVNARERHQLQKIILNIIIFTDTCEAVRVRIINHRFFPSACVLTLAAYFFASFYRGRLITLSVLSITVKSVGAFTLTQRMQSYSRLRRLPTK